MIGPEELLVAFVILYFFESIMKLDIGSVLFSGSRRGGFRLQSISSRMGTRPFGCAILNPFAPLSPAFVIPAKGHWTTLGLLLRDPKTNEWSLSPFTGSDDPALRALAKLTPKALSQAVEREAERRMAIDQIQTDLDRFSQITRNLRRMSLIALILLLGILPVGSYMIGFRLALVCTGCILLLLGLATCCLCFRAHRVLYPALPAVHRWVAATTHLFYPVSLLYAIPRLSQNLLTSYDAVAVAAVLAGKDALLALASSRLVELRHGIVPGHCDSSVTAAISEDRERSERQLLTFLRNVGIEPPSISPHRDRVDPLALSFCPMCGAEFLHADGICTDCVSIALVPFDRATNKAHTNA